MPALPAAGLLGAGDYCVTDQAGNVTVSRELLELGCRVLTRHKGGDPDRESVG
jgi:hypothetical protein